jgi:hypothetical protein
VPSAKMAEETRLDVLGLERLFEEEVVSEEDLRDGEVVCPECFDKLQGEY